MQPSPNPAPKSVGYTTRRLPLPRLLAAALAVMALTATPARAQTTIATGNDPSAPGYLSVTADAYGSWGQFGPIYADRFRPAQLALGSPGFGCGFFLFVGGRGQRELLSAQTGWQNFLPDDSSLSRAVLQANAAQDTDGDSVADTLTSAFRVHGGVTDLRFDLAQRVTSFAAGGAALLEQVYTIRNASTAAVSFELVRHYDGDLLWDGSYNDAVGTTANTWSRGASVYTQEPGYPGATRIRFGSPLATAYYGTKANVTPPGGGPTPAAGSTRDVWGAYGLPPSWVDFIANVGVGVDGDSGAVPGGDAAVGLSFQLTLQPGEVVELPLRFVYGDPQADRLAFAAAPALATAGATWPPLAVELRDAGGNRVDTATGTVTVSLAQGSGVLGGTLSVPVLDGVATFTDLTYDRAETIAVDVTAPGLQGVADHAVIVRPFVSDLRVVADDVVATPASPQVGQQVHLEALVRNVGQESSTALVTFYRGDPLFGGTQLGSDTATIPPGGAHTFEAWWTPAAAGAQGLLVVVENQTPPEATPADNRAARSIQVGAAAESLQVVAGQQVAWPGASRAVAITINNTGAGSATIAAATFGPPSWLTPQADVLGRTLLPGESLVALADLDVPLGTPGAPLHDPPVVEQLPITVETATASFAGALVVKLFDQPTNTVSVRVVDATTQAALVGALVSARDLPGSFVTDGTGQVALDLPPGPRDLFAYKQGYVAAVSTVDAASATAILALAPGATLGIEQVVSEPLSSAQIAERGISLTDPVNNRFFDFTVAMQIGSPLVLPSVEVPIAPPPGTSYEFRSVAYVADDPAPVGDSVRLGGGGVLVTARFEYHAHGRTETWIVVPGQVAVLKQFFDVAMLVVNNASAGDPSDVQLQNVRAELVLPAVGLGLPDLDGSPQLLVRQLGTLDAGDQAQATWTVRGDLPGDYTLTGLVAADLVAFQQAPGTPLSATAVSDPFTVTSPRLRCEFQTPQTVQADQAFAFGVLVTNEAATVANQVRVQLRSEDLVHCHLANAVDAVDLGDLAPGQTGEAVFQLVAELSGTVVRLETQSGCSGPLSPPVEVRADPPVVNQHPASQFVCAGDPARFYVDAVGAGPLDYQWYLDGVAIPGAAAYEYVIDPVATADAGEYHVVVTNAGGATPSAAAILTVGTAPDITGQPSSAVICSGDPVTFAVTATASPAPSYQWRKDGAPIAGATTATLTIAAVAAADGGAYDVEVANTCGVARSAAATLTVVEPPTITGDPQAVAATEGEPVGFAIAVSGTGPFTYQWRRDGVDLAGATAATLLIDPVAVGDAGSYDVVVSNGCGSVTSAAAALTVNQRPVVTCNGAVVLWSPNHELVDVRGAFSVTDPDGDPTTLRLRVVSDEPEVPETGDGTGRHAPDFKDELVGGRGLLLRSERKGNADGRFYVVVVEADDGNGGVTVGVCLAAVCPHDQTQPSVDLVTSQAMAAIPLVAAALQADFSAAVPGGLHEHGLAAPLGPIQ